MSDKIYIFVVDGKRKSRDDVVTSKKSCYATPTSGAGLYRSNGVHKNKLV